MLMKDSSKLYFALTLIVLLLVDFIVNVFILDGNNKKQLEYDEWVKVKAFDGSASNFAATNEIFGVKTEIDQSQQTALLEQQRKEAERVAAEEAAKRELEKLNIDEQDISLFGITLQGDLRIALLRVETENSNIIHRLKTGDTLQLQDGKVELKIEKIETRKIRVSVKRRVEESLKTFELVIFNYGY